LLSSVRRPAAPPYIYPILILALLAITTLMAARLATRHRSETEPDGGPAASSEVRVPIAEGTPVFGHVYLIVLENKDAQSLDSPSAAPYWNQLRRQYAYAADYSALYHPSQPNYVALFAGARYNFDDDGQHDVNAPSIADQLEQHGRTWRVYAENYPGQCFTSGIAQGGEDGPGTYVRKHNPAISFTSISGNWQRCQNITDFSHFAVGAADYNLIVPNMCHDMHDCDISTGDKWLSTFVPTIIGNPNFGPNDVLFITFDESEGKDPQNHVATLVISKLVRPGFSSSVPYTHYSLLRTIQDSWNLGCLEESCEAGAMTDFFSAK
jgi:hypothetical protein